MMKDAIPLKPYFGFMSYMIMMVKVVLVNERARYQYDAEVDGKKWPNQEGEDYSIVTDIFSHQMGKFAGHNVTTPTASINDGLIELYFLTEVLPLSKLLES